jgi:hypothetical protein
MLKQQFFHTEEARSEFGCHVKATLDTVNAATPPPNSHGPAWEYFVLVHALLVVLNDIVDGARVSA